MLLECTNLVKNFGSFRAISNLSFGLDSEIKGLVGPNGSGKTTLFNLITGIDSPNEGQINFKGTNIQKMKPHAICRLGIARTFQVPRFFSSMSTLENVTVGARFGHMRSRGDHTKKAIEALGTVGLTDKYEISTKSLNTYDKKMMMIATAIATGPEILLLDEPLAGLTFTEIAQAIDVLRKLRDTGTSIVVIEHNMRAVRGLVDSLLVLDHGEKIAEGKPETVMNDVEVQKAYLGTAII